MKKKSEGRLAESAPVGRGDEASSPAGARTGKSSQTPQLWYTAKYRELSLAAISLISTV